MVSVNTETRGAFALLAQFECRIFNVPAAFVILGLGFGVTRDKEDEAVATETEDASEPRGLTRSRASPQAGEDEGDDRRE